jgi:hypothetical protein
MQPTRKEVLRQIEIVRGGLIIAMSTIRRMKANQKVDTGTVLKKLGAIRSEAKGVMDRAAASPSKTPRNGQNKQLVKTATNYVRAQRDADLST